MIPANLTTLAHFSVSSAMILPNSAGEPASAVLQLLIGKRSGWIGVFDLMLTRKHHRKHLQIHCRVLLAHPRNGLFTVLLEIPEQRTNYRLAQPVREPRSLPAGLPGSPCSQCGEGMALLSRCCR